MASDLVWADPATLLVSYAQYVGGEGDSGMDQSSGRNVPWQVLRLGRGPAGPRLAARRRLTCGAAGTGSW